MRIPPISSRLLAGVLTHFQQQYPDIEVVLFEGTLQEVHDMQVFVARGHRLHSRTSVAANDLREERLIMPRTGCEFPDIFDQNRVKHGPHIRYQASDGATILTMVREGLGITILPRMMFPEKLEGITGIPLDPPRQLQIGLAIRSQETASPGATLFVQTAVAWVQEQTSLLPRAR